LQNFQMMHLGKRTAIVSCAPYYRSVLKSRHCFIHCHHTTNRQQWRHPPVTSYAHPTTSTAAPGMGRIHGMGTRLNTGELQRQVPLCFDFTGHFEASGKQRPPCSDVSTPKRIQATLSPMFEVQNEDVAQSHFRYLSGSLPEVWSTF
jgi:hypothetical protein